MAKRYTNENRSRKHTSTQSSNIQADLQNETAVTSSLRWPVIPTAILFILLTALAGSMDNIVEKWIGLLSAVVSLTLLLVVKRNTLAKAYQKPLFLAFTSYIIWGGISTFYAASGKFAVFEFSKLLFAFCIYLAVLSITGSEESGFHKIAYVLASTGSFFGIISIDAASSEALSKLFKDFIGLFTSVYANRGAFEEGIRITGIFGNPNIYAGFMAIAVFFSLYLTLNASNKRNAIISTILLAVNSLSYLLAFSLGSLFMFIISCLIMISISERNRRIDLFILMAETAVLAFLFASLSMLGLGKSGAVSFVPIVAVVLNALLLYLVDSSLRNRIVKQLEFRKKLSLRIVALIIIIIAGYMIAAFNVSGELSLAGKESVMRAIYVSGGDYRLSVDSTNPVTLKIESQNENDLIRHTSSRLFTGTNQKEISFTVPNDSKIVMITFSGGEGGSILHSAKYSGASQGDIHMNYPLLPNIMANRLQNIFANENMVQRGTFFDDGMKLFLKSPVIGRGLGGFENGVYSVQDFYYETKYAHNHYIQVLSDLGIIGLIFFILILISCVFSVARSKLKGKSLFALPVLAACIFQIFGQAFTDATWSAGVFLGFAAATLALITIYCANTMKETSALNKASLRVGEKSVLILFTAVFVLLLSGNLYAQAHARSGVKDFKDIQRLIALDRFEQNDYKVSYILNAPKSGSDEIMAQADTYAQELIEEESNSIAPYVMSYNFQTYKDFDAFNAAKQGLKNAGSYPYMWTKIFDLCEEYIDPVGPYTDDAADRLKTPQYYVDSVLELYDALIKRNSKSLDKITLTPYNNAFIGKLLEIRETHLYSIDWVFTVIMTYAFDSECAVDANQDGIPDSISAASGHLQRNDDGLLEVSDNTVLNLNLYHKLKGNYTFTIRTVEAPHGIKVSLNGVDQQVVYKKNDAYITVVLPNNSDMELSKFKVTFPKSTVIDHITYTTNLE